MNFNGFVVFSEKWDYKGMMRFAIGCDTKYENAVDAFQILFQQIRNDLSNCAFAPHRFVAFWNYAMQLYLNAIRC